MEILRPRPGQRAIRAAAFAAIVAMPLCARGAAGQAGQGPVVLDTTGFWRLHYVLRPPVFSTPDGTEVSDVGYTTPPPGEGWTAADFDDSEWLRSPGQPFPPIKSSWAITFKANCGFISTHEDSASLAMIAMRGKFAVTDPPAAGPLLLSVEYRGGVVVYLNGKEIARANLPADGGPEALAEAYPADAWLDADGKLLMEDPGEKDQDRIARWSLRTRSLENVAVPSSLLRPGVNVLAIEVHRSPYPKEAVDKIKAIEHAQSWPRYNWCTCGVRYVRLTAASRAGARPNVARPSGMQVWNSNPMQPDFDLDWGDPNEPLRPIRIVGCGNGRFSGKVVVGDTADIRQLAAEMSDLDADGATLPASAVEIRYAVAEGATGQHGAESHYRASPSRFDALLAEPPDVVPVRQKKPGRANTTLRREGQPDEVFGAVVPVWLTVHVPRDAAPGAYKGTLRISSAGNKPVDVPVEVEVAGYALPDATDYRTVVDLVESPESVALQYGVPLWSDRHFELLAASYRQLARIGNRSMYVHLVAESNMGNSESIVRWVPKPGGEYGYDFAPFDKYLDTVVKNMGTPRMVVLYLWDYHLPKRGKAPVTSVDESGKTSTIELPLFNTDEGAALWKPVADHIMAQLKARGLAEAAMLGPIPDTAPPKDVADQLSDLFPGARWMRQGHSARRDIQGHPIAYQALVWTPRWPDGPDAESMHGWDQDDDIVQFMRSGEDTPLTIPRLLGEMNIIGRQKGFGRIGVDFWSVLETSDNRGRTRSSDVIGRYPDSTWNNLEWMTRYMLVPGENGAVSTTRYEMMCEGIQECQAVILLDEALTKQTLSGELARRCGEALKARLSATITALDNHLNSGLTKLEGHSWWSTPTLLGNEWFVGSRWQDRSATLYSLAGEVQDGRGATAAGDQQK